MLFMNVHTALQSMTLTRDLRSTRSIPAAPATTLLTTLANSATAIAALAIPLQDQELQLFC